MAKLIDLTKILIRNIFKNNSDIVSILGKLQQVPDYSSIHVQRYLLEYIEGLFHDILGTYFEHLTFNKLNKEYKIGKQDINVKLTKERLQYVKNLYVAIFPKGNSINFGNEIANIEYCVNINLMPFIQNILCGEITDITHSPQDHRIGNARDVYIDMLDGTQINLSLKVDKSNKIALFDGQTTKVFEKVYNRYFGISEKDFEKILKQKYSNAETLFSDFQNVAELTQLMIIKGFGLDDCYINNFTNAKITNRHQLIAFLKNLNRYKNGNDNAIVIIADRNTGKLSNTTLFNSIDLNNIYLDDFSFSPGIPKKYKYNTTISMRYKNKSFISFQTKHQRGKYPSEKFRDITIRLNKTIS